MTNLRKVREDFFYEIYEDFFEGERVRFSRNKFTGEINISADDTARVLGFNSIKELLGTDAGLDVINEWKRNNPGKPLFGKRGSGAMIEEAGHRFYG